MKRTIKVNPFNLRAVLIFITVVTILAIGAYLLKPESPKICVVDQGDVVCVSDDLKSIKRHEFISVNKKAFAISTPKDKSKFLVLPNDNSINAGLDVYDKFQKYTNHIDIPVAAYDLQKTQWSDDGNMAYLLSNIGVLYSYDFDNSKLTQITKDRAEMQPNEDFNEYLRGFVVDYYLQNNGDIILSAQNIDIIDANNQEESLFGPLNETKLFRLSADMQSATRIGEIETIDNLTRVNDSEYLISVNPTDQCEWGDECRQLYSVNIDNNTESLVAGKNWEFRSYSYDNRNKYIYLTRGPGGSVAEVYYGKLKNFESNAKRVKLSQANIGTNQGSRGLVALNKDELATISYINTGDEDDTEYIYGDNMEGIIEVFNLKTGNRQSSLDSPAINFIGVESLVNSW